MILEELEAKLSWGKRAKKASFCQKSQPFEQKVDLKPKTLDFRHLRIFANSEKKLQKCLSKP